MKITKWTDINGMKNYIDPGDERRKYWNHERSKAQEKAFKILRDTNFESEEEKNKVWAEELKKWENIPNYTDEEKAEEWGKVESDYYEAVVQCLIDTGIRVSQEDHQCDYIPVADDKYVMMFSFRVWSGILAEVWNRLHSNEPERNYLDYYCRWTGDETRVTPEEAGMEVEVSDE